MTQLFVQDFECCWRGLASFPRTQHAVRFVFYFVFIDVKYIYIILVETQVLRKGFPLPPKLFWQPLQIIVENLVFFDFFKKEQTKNYININRN